MAKKVWSFSTTLRNPNRIGDFVATLSEMKGKEWNINSQCEFQIRLIKNRIYGSENTQFLNNLSDNSINIISDLKRKITFNEAENIFNEKNYQDPSMRGRTSFSPLKEIGLVKIDNNRIKITEFGKLFMNENYDLGELLFIFLLKWQYPNPITSGFSNGYNIKPFINK